MRKEILRTGTFTGNRKVEITKQIIDEIANNFDNETSLNSAGYKVPLYPGHPNDETRTKANGWISRLSVEGNSLFAELNKLTAQTLKDIKDFSWRDVSVSVGKNILKHLALTNDPAVSYLADFQYEGQSDDDEIWTFAESQKPKKETTMSTENEIKLAGEKKDLEVQLTAATGKIDALEAEKTELTDSKTALESEKTELTKANGELTKENTDIKKKMEDEATAVELSKDTEFVETLCKDGKLLPADKDTTITCLTSFPNEKADGQEKSPKDLYKDSLSAKGVELEDGEKFAKGEKPSVGEAKLIKLTNERARADKITYNQASVLVLAENPTLNTSEA